MTRETGCVAVAVPTRETTVHCAAVGTVEVGTRQGAFFEALFCALVVGVGRQRNKIMRETDYITRRTS